MGRELRPEMIEFFNQKLVGNGLYQDAFLKKDARTIMRLAAQVCVGIREQGGNNRGPMVSLIQDTVGGPDHVAWCMSFVQTCIGYAELKTGAKSGVAVGEHCLTVWRQTPEGQRVKFTPLAGAIVIWRHGSSDAGHTGIVESCDETSFFAYEGNTESGLNPNGKVERDGGGVYHTHRARSGNGDMKVVGFLKPF